MPPPPPPDELIVWLGQVPVIDTFVPATKDGVAVPVPPFATASVPARVTAPVVAVAGVRPVVPALNDVTPPPPPPVEAMVWLGHVPVMVTLEPATSEGVAVPLPPLATGKMPVTPVVKGKPVRLVAVPDAGVPRVGVTITGDVNRPATLTFLVVVPWTIGKTSVPPSGVVADGSWEILTFAIV